jgi:hypothetical protein
MTRTFSLRHEVARWSVWHAVVTRPGVPSAVSDAEARLRRESRREDGRKTSGRQGPEDPLARRVRGSVCC